MRVTALLAGSAMVLASLATPAIAKKKAKGADAAASAINKDPYPSTYRAYPGVPTAVTNVTVYDGKGQNSSMPPSISAMARWTRLKRAIRSKTGTP